jgi:exosome complex component RRP43
MGKLKRAYYGRIILMDPTDDEECNSSTLVTVQLDHDGGLCGISKLGGDPMSKEQIQKCINLSKLRLKEILNVLSTA